MICFGAEYLFIRNIICFIRNAMYAQNKRNQTKFTIRMERFVFFVCVCAHLQLYMQTLTMNSFWFNLISFHFIFVVVVFYSLFTSR